MDDAIEANAEIADKILEAGLAAYGLVTRTDESIAENSDATRNSPSPQTAPPWHNQMTLSDLDKARSTIRQLYRDWSEEGAKERSDCYTTVRSALSQFFDKIQPSSRHQVRVLVPGAGLGRLVFDLVHDGYSVEGNEISHHQLLGSHFILNCTKRPKEFTLYPWAYSFSNHVSRKSQFRKVMVPDVHPATALQKASEGHEVSAFERMSMIAADFCVNYRTEEQKDVFDAVTTVFFIDTAPNLLAYIETVQNCLRSGGIWINIGPLLWHFEKKVPAEDDETKPRNQNLGIGEAGSVELTHEEVMKLLEHYNFEIIDEGAMGDTGYIEDQESMLHNLYHPRYWTARKK